jgi:crotonobetainyl-CoA hydratase
MSYQFALVEREGPITLITINRPEVMNALHGPAHRELSGILDDFAKDPDQWVAIITGGGEKAFSAGNDLKATVASGGVIDIPPTGFAGLTARYDLLKPVIAAVNGLAMGGGFEIALACDIIVAAENATFSLPEPRVGLAALAGGLLRLPRAVGEKRAMELILTSRRVSAQEGKELGFVAEVAPQGKAVEVAKRIAKTICEASPMSIRASKQVVMRGMEENLADAMTGQWQYPASVALFTSEDVREGPLAFAQKRPPQWKGR